jgi:uncharacterized protein (TIGR03083 family)
MGLTDGRSEREVFDDLVGAYALDAVDADEALALDQFISRDPDAAREAERLREAASWLGAIGALEPPSSLRARLLTTAGERPSKVTPQEAYKAETERLDSLFGELDASELDVETANGLTVTDLVVHLAALDAAFASELRTPNMTWIGADQVAAITEDVLPAAAPLPYATRVQRWRESCRELLDAAATTEQERAGGYAVEDVLTIRAFEAWTHNEDIRRATGRPSELPNPAVFHTMADLSARSLGAAMTVRGVAHPGKTARLVLTGAGGGEWLVPLAHGESAAPVADVEIRVPVLEWCLRFADRIAADEMRYEAEGDAMLARDAVAAAPAFAGL